ncbi:MAG: type II toxin-antitoxin system Phd/YefM family antitoxin [Kiritimatiellia bacterium]
MTITENIYAAKTHFSQLVARAMAGDEVIIAKAGQPVVCIVPYHEKHPSQRKPGSAAGQFQMSNDFDAPLSEAELQDWGS